MQRLCLQSGLRCRLHPLLLFQHNLHVTAIIAVPSQRWPSKCTISTADEPSTDVLDSARCSRLQCADAESHQFWQAPESCLTLQEILNKNSHNFYSICLKFIWPWSETSAVLHHLTKNNLTLLRCDSPWKYLPGTYPTQQLRQTSGSHSRPAAKQGHCLLQHWLFAQWQPRKRFLQLFEHLPHGIPIVWPSTLLNVAEQ